MHESWMTQKQLQTAVTPIITQICKKYGITATVEVRNESYFHEKKKYPFIKVYLQKGPKLGDSRSRNPRFQQTDYKSPISFTFTDIGKKFMSELFTNMTIEKLWEKNIDAASFGDEDNYLSVFLGNPYLDTTYEVTVPDIKESNLTEASLGQEQKKLIASKLKPVLAKYGVKGTLSVRNGSTISLSIVEGTIDFIGNAANVMATQVIDKPQYYSVVKNLLKYNEVQVNDRQIASQFSGNAKTALLAILKVLNINNYSKSDWTNDWVQVGHYVNINIGKTDKPYKCTGTPEKPNDQLKTILGDQTVKESKLVQDKTKLIATIKQILKPSNTSIKVEGGKDDSMVVTITKSDIDFVSNYAKVQTTAPNPAVIRVSQSIPGLKLQFDGEAFTIFHKLLNALSKEGLTLDKSTTPFISFKIVPKTFKYTGNKEQGLMEDAKQLIQNPILKVFDQFGKQYLAQVLDASLNKMIQAAARRGVKVTVPQLIAEIKDKPNGETAKALFKAMATVIKQVSAQIPTIVTTNVSSISEGKLTENQVIDSTEGVPDDILKQAKRTKDYYPYRIVFIVKDKNTKKWDVWAKTTMHSANRLAREGHEVHIVSR